MSTGPCSAPAPVARVPTLGPRRAFLIFLAYFATQIAVGVTIGGSVVWFALRRGALPNALADVQNGVVVAASFFGSVLSGLVALRMARRSLPGPIRSGVLQPLGWSRASSRELWLGALAGVALAVLYLFGLNGLSAGTTPAERLGPLEAAAASGGWSRLGWAVLLILVAPPVEEFVFRGVVFTGLSRAWTQGSSAIVVTGLFLSQHWTQASGPALVAIMLVGFATVVARVVTSSLAPAILLHASYNSCVVLAVYAGAAR